MNDIPPKTLEGPLNIVIGASGGIGSALASLLAKRDGPHRLVTISRTASLAIGRHHFQYSPSGSREQSACEEVIEECVKRLTEQFGNTLSTARVFICIGRLHGEDLRPEKRLEELNESGMLASFHTNTVLPVLWLRHLTPRLDKQQICRCACISARVGSISDNGLGGWYSYRAAKAALNMMIKTASIEWARRNKNLVLAAMHPGTVDTELSKPFQARVPAHKLFSPEKSAGHLLAQLDALAVSGTAHYVDWQGETIPW